MYKVRINEKCENIFMSSGSYHFYMMSLGAIDVLAADVWKTLETIPCFHRRRQFGSTKDQFLFLFGIVGGMQSLICSQITDEMVMNYYYYYYYYYYYRI